VKGPEPHDSAIDPDALPVAAAVLDAQGCVIEHNALVCALLGLDPDQVRGLKLERVVAVPHHVQRLRDHLAAAWGERGHPVCELWLRKPGGGVINVRVRSTAVVSEDGPRCHMVLSEVPPGLESRERPSSRPPPPHEADREGRGRTVLVVEDESLVRKAVQHYLSAAGYRVLTASDRAGALSCCAEANAALDLVLTDLSLADGSTGPDLAELIRAQRPGVGVLYMTACPADLLARRGFHVPAGDTLEKPFSKDALLERVRRALEKR
jgi:PAS domain S-box-containing protein